VTSRLTGAIVRAVLVMMVITFPSVVMIDVGADTNQTVTLAALILGGMVFAEYKAVYPSLIEFRDAAPFNRLRFVMFASTLMALSLAHPNTILPYEIQIQCLTIANQVGSALDFPFSPARLLSQTADDGTTQEFLRNGAGLAYVICLAWMAIFTAFVRIGGWPSSKKPLNVWVNLPMFDPTAGSDVVVRLSRYGRWNILLGFVLPFLIPLVVGVFAGQHGVFQSIPLHSLIWMIALWAYFPASLILRGTALLRIAELIVQTRAAHGATAGKSFAPA
jgi:hypothetical protein